MMTFIVTETVTRRDELIKVKLLSIRTVRYDAIEDIMKFSRKFYKKVIHRDSSILDVLDGLGDVFTVEVYDGIGLVHKFTYIQREIDIPCV